MEWSSIFHLFILYRGSLFSRGPNYFHIIVSTYVLFKMDNLAITPLLFTISIISHSTNCLFLLQPELKPFFSRTFLLLEGMEELIFISPTPLFPILPDLFPCITPKTARAPPMLQIQRALRPHIFSFNLPYIFQHFSLYFYFFQAISKRMRLLPKRWLWRKRQSSRGKLPG